MEKNSKQKKAGDIDAVVSFMENWIVGELKRELGCLGGTSTERNAVTAWTKVSFLNCGCTLKLALVLTLKCRGGNYYKLKCYNRKQKLLCEPPVDVI